MLFSYSSKTFFNVVVWLWKASLEFTRLKELKFLSAVVDAPRLCVIYYIQYNSY
jgi:hypothetical protein